LRATTSFIAMLLGLDVGHRRIVVHVTGLVTGGRKFDRLVYSR
jgi:hypothetical protein